MNVAIKKSKLCGRLDLSVKAPSKSIMHREIICSALAGDKMPFYNSDDIKCTYGVMQHILHDDLPCYVGESASTLRFLIPLSVLLGGRTFKTAGRLSMRPLTEYECLKDAFIKISENSIVTGGNITGGVFNLCGNISSQFVSGLLFVLPLLEKDSEIIIKERLESAPYVNITIDVLSKYGINIEKTESGFFVHGMQSYKAAKPHKIEGDRSYAAFFEAANLLGGDIILDGLFKNSVQGDSAFSQLALKSRIDMTDNPDLFMPLCVVACNKTTPTYFYNAKRLRLKESDRLHEMARQLKVLGADVCEGESSFEIAGGARLSGGEVFSGNDHRIAMALTVLGCMLCSDTLILHNAECVNKSVPAFFSHMRRLGADIEILL